MYASSSPLISCDILPHNNRPLLALLLIVDLIIATSLFMLLSKNIAVFNTPHKYADVACQHASYYGGMTVDNAVDRVVTIKDMANSKVNIFMNLFGKDNYDDFCISIKNLLAKIENDSLVLELLQERKNIFIEINVIKRKQKREGQEESYQSDLAEIKERLKEKDYQILANKDVYQLAVLLNNKEQKERVSNNTEEITIKFIMILFAGFFVIVLFILSMKFLEEHTEENQYYSLKVIYHHFCLTVAMTLFILPIIILSLASLI